MIFLAQALQALELFAGRSVVTRCFRSRGFRAAAVDVEYWPSYNARAKSKGRRLPKKNFFDITSPEGFCAAVLACLSCQSAGQVVVIAVVCSSFVSISRGSTGRSYLNPCGWKHVSSVALGNLLAARPGLCPCLGIWPHENSNPQFGLL